MKRKKAIRRKSNKRKLMQECDLLVKELVHERDGWKCVADGECGVRCAGRPVQAAHLLPKGKHPRIRWMPDNLLSLCFFHHIIWAHRDPLAFAAFVGRKYPGLEERLRELAERAEKVDLEELQEQLKGRGV